VAVEVALSLVLLIGAGLMLRSLWELQTTDPGFDEHNVLTLAVLVNKQQFTDPRQESAFFDAVLQRVWKEYLVVAARALEEQLRDRDQVDESDEEHEKPRSGMSVEVDLDSAAFEQTEEIAIPFEEPGNGRRRKHE